MDFFDLTGKSQNKTQILRISCELILLKLGRFVLQKSFTKKVPVKLSSDEIPVETSLRKQSKNVKNSQNSNIPLNHLRLLLFLFIRIKFIFEINLKILLQR